MPVAGSTVTYNGKPAYILSITKDTSGNITQVLIKPEQGRIRHLSYSDYQAGTR